MGSYRTYEEWKPCPRSGANSKGYSSYRTYEEWKLSLSSSSTMLTIVLTVPMRNGNSEE